MSNENTVIGKNNGLYRSRVKNNSFLKPHLDLQAISTVLC